MTEQTDSRMAEGDGSDPLLDTRLKAALASVEPPAGLRQLLLDIPGAAPGGARLFGLATHANTLLYRVLPVAACLVAAIGIALYTRDSQRDTLLGEIFAHVYGETAFLDSLGPRDTLIPLAQINKGLEQVVGARLLPGTETESMEVTFAKDCWVAKQIAYHLIMRGKTGEVSVIMIPDLPLEDEYKFADERYNGLVTPTDGGYLVVVGSKQEPILEYRNLLSANLNWKY